MSGGEFLLEIDYMDPTIPAVRTMRATTGRGLNIATAPGYYQPTIKQAATLDRTIWQDDQVFGSGKLALGDAILNAGALTPGGVRPYDFLISNKCSVAGRTARLLFAPTGFTTYSSAQALFSGTMDGFSFSKDASQVTFRWRDAVANLVDLTAQYHQYLGNNALPNGVEGVADLLGQYKAVIVGICLNVTLACVNTSQPLYQLSDNLCVNESRFVVYDKGAIVTKGTARASLAALIAAAPGANTYDYFLDASGSYIKLGYAPNGTITADIVQGANAAARTVAQIYSALLQSWGVSAGSISSADITALDTAQSGEVGYAMGQSAETRRSVLDQIVSSAGAIYWQDQAGVWRIKQVAAASGSPVVTFKLLSISKGIYKSAATDIDIISIERLLPTTSNGEPVQTTNLQFNKNWTVQNADAVLGIALTRLAFLQDEWRSATPAHDATIATNYLNSRILTEQTYFNDGTVTATEATRRQALRGVFRSWYNIVCMLDPVTAVSLQDLAVVNVMAPYYDLTSGKLGIIGRIQYDAQQLLAQILVYV